MDLTNYYSGLYSRRFYCQKLNHNNIVSWMEFYENNPNLKYLGINLKRSNIEMAKAWIGAQLERYENNEFGYLGAFSKTTRKLVGTIGFKKTNYCKVHELEKAIAIKPEFWNKGIGKEISIMMINFAFKNNFTEKIIGVRHIENKPSKIFYKKLGFSDCAIHKEKSRLIVRFQLPKKDWEEKKEIYSPTWKFMASTEETEQLNIYSTLKN